MIDRKKNVIQQSNKRKRDISSGVEDENGDDNGYYSKHLIIVYTNIITPRILSSIEARYLRVIPVGSIVAGDKKKSETADNQKIFLQFDRVEYCQLERFNIASISITIANQYGRLIPFASSYLPTYLMLHFVKNS